MLTTGSEKLVVVGESGEPIGTLTVGVCSRLLSLREEVAS
jgi:hypothetical protein